MNELINYLIIGICFFLLGSLFGHKMWFKLGQASGYINGVSNAVSILVWKKRIFNGKAKNGQLEEVKE